QNRRFSARVISAILRQIQQKLTDSNAFDRRNAVTEKRINRHIGPESIDLCLDMPDLDVLAGVPVWVDNRLSFRRLEKQNEVRRANSRARPS
ncbi:hypothetical protein ABTD83_19455, partial [Acinetobacter baumannii]